MSVEPSLAGGVCADCGTLITNAEVLAEVVVRVTAVTEPEGLQLVPEPTGSST